MRVAVISDIHSNLAALEAVLADVDAHAPDEIWCLGDVVGYNARPAQCLSIMRERADVLLAGNHDLVVSGRIPMETFRSSAADAALWTRQVLSADELDYLGKLVPFAEQHGVELYHASIRDPIWEYVIDRLVAEACLRQQGGPLSLVGHSHIALALRLSEPEGVAGGQAHDGYEAPLAGRTALLNPGSVGQPRDGDPRAAWLLLDLGAQTAHFHRVDYDIARAQAEIREAGLPESLAERLERGL